MTVTCAPLEALLASLPSAIGAVVVGDREHVAGAGGGQREGEAVAERHAGVERGRRAGGEQRVAAVEGGVGER